MRFLGRVALLKVSINTLTSLKNVTCIIHSITGNLPCMKQRLRPHYSMDHFWCNLSQNSHSLKPVPFLLGKQKKALHPLRAVRTVLQLKHQCDILKERTCYLLPRTSRARYLTLSENKRKRKSEYRITK